MIRDAVILLLVNWALGAAWFATGFLPERLGGWLRFPYSPLPFWAQLQLV